MYRESNRKGERNGVFADSDRQVNNSSRLSRAAAGGLGEKKEKKCERGKNRESESSSRAGSF